MLSMPLDRRKLFDGIMFSFHLNFWNFLLICLCFCLSHSPAEPSSCPIECKCIFSQETVNCSNRSLRKLPLLIPQNVAVLSFHNNKITGSELQSKAFSHLTNLKYLDLSDNRLKVVNLTFSSRLPIKILKFDRCVLNGVPTINGGKRLTELHLSHNSISNITERFNGWSKLEILDLSFNKIRILPNNTFRYLTSLKRLDLSKNRIHVIESRALVGLTSLEIFLMSRNRVRDMRNFTHCLTKDRACIGVFANLLHLDFSRNHLSRLDGLTFQGIKKLETLLLSHNNIATLGDGAFYDLLHLLNLQLDSNRITRISQKWLYNLQSLQNLSLSHNNVSVIEVETWTYCKDLKHLNASSNKLDRLRYEMFAKLEKLVSLDISDNHVAVLEDRTFRDLKALNTLDLSRNHLSSAIEDLSGSFEGLPNLRFMSLHSNSIRFLTPSIFSGLSRLRYLDLTKNNITSITSRTFDNLTNLAQLHMDSSSLLCDCKLASFALWLDSHRTDVTASINVSCFHPLSLKGSRLSDIEADQLVCGEHPVPSLLQQPGDIRSLRGENVTLECSASATLPAQKDGLPPSSVNMTAVWRKGPNKDTVKENSFIRIRDVQRPEGSHIFFTSLLLFFDVGYSNEDYYSCMIKNDYGHVTSPSAYLSVVALPRIVRSPRNKTVKYESEVKVYCQAFGHPLPRISWERADGKKFSALDEYRLNLNDSTSASRPRDGDTTENVPLHIKPVKPSDAGRYKCTATSEVGVDSAYVNIIVLYPPIIEGMIPEIKTQAGDTTVIKCMVDAYPSPTIEWLLNNSSLYQSTRHFLAANKQLLVIVDTQVEDQGVYTCSVSNKLGMRRNSTHLTLVGDEPPGIGDEFGGLSGVVLIVIVCILATSLVWLLYLCCAKRMKEAEDAKTGADQPPCCEVCYKPLEPSCHQPHPPLDLHHHGMLYRTPDLLPSLPPCPIHNREYFNSFPRNSRTDVAFSTNPSRSRSSECIRCGCAVDRVAEERPLIAELRRAPLRRPTTSNRDAVTSAADDENVDRSARTKKKKRRKHRPPDESAALSDNPP